VVSTDGRSATERPHVLIVSDDPDLSEFLSEGLTLGGFWTSVVASAIQTLEVFRLRSFDLVLLDAALSAMGATELLRRLRTAQGDDRPRTDVPIVFVAGSPQEIEERAAIAAGADGVLYPPLELEELVPLLFAAVDRWRAQHPGRPYADQIAQADDYS
jgi:DNA-binding response OmpR family regulator